MEECNQLQRNIFLEWEDFGVTLCFSYFVEQLHDESIEMLHVVDCSELLADGELFCVEVDHQGD